MLILGLLLLLAAAAVVTYTVLATVGMADVRLDYGILNIDLPPLWLYLAGLLTLAVAALGLWMVGAGARSKARRAREVRELRKQAKVQDRRVERADDATTGRGTTARPSTGSTAPGSVPPRPGSTPPAGGAADRSRLDLDR
jgi:membrane protein implicated in regulation of membrane protease activity